MLKCAGLGALSLLEKWHYLDRMVESDVGEVRVAFDVTTDISGERRVWGGQKHRDPRHRVPHADHLTAMVSGTAYTLMNLFTRM